VFTTPLTSRLSRALLLALLLALLAACGGGSQTSAPTSAPSGETSPGGKADPTAARAEEPTAAPETTGEARLVEATFAKQLGENQEPVDPTEEFYPDETIYLSLEFEGRPKEGVVSSEFFWGEESIASAEVNFADVNSGVLVSIGQSTFAGFNLTHENPLPISGNYRVESTLDGEPLGTYAFAVVPPEDAIASEVTEVTLAMGEDNFTPVDPTDQFVAEDEVYLVGSGNFGLQSWLKVEWYVDGELDDAGTKTLGPLEENLEDGGFSFYYRPDGGWPEGEHEAVLYVDDEQVGSYAFTVGALAQEPSGGITLGDSGDTTVQIEALETFSPESGLFTIEAPAGWEFSDNSNEVSANYAWTDPTGTAGIIISLYEDPSELSEADLIEQGTSFVESVFGSEPNFEIAEQTPQSDGSVLIAWTATPDIDGPVDLVGLTYIEQREDKVSLLNVLMPADEYEALWDAAFNQIVNSYRIDPSVDIIVE
jgi:hypothetical protein